MSCCPPGSLPALSVEYQPIGVFSKFEDMDIYEVNFIIIFIFFFSFFFEREKRILKNIVRYLKQMQTQQSLSFMIFLDLMVLLEFVLFVIKYFSFSFSFSLTHLISNKIAQQTGYTVFLPDYYRGTKWPAGLPSPLHSLSSLTHLHSIFTLLNY
jgi:hypothetical protein